MSIKLVMGAPLAGAAARAETAAEAAEADAVQTAADRVQTGLDAAATAADRIATDADATQTDADVAQTAADRVQTGLDATATAADRVQTGLDAAAAAASAAEAALYDGPKVDTFADLASVTPEQLAVGTYIRVIETGLVYQRAADAASDADLDYTGSGGVKLNGVTKGRNAGSLAPAYVQTLETGLAWQTPDNVSATLAISVTGTKGSTTLTTTETSKVAGIGSTTRAFEAALTPASGSAFFATVLGNNGSTTITLRDPLEYDFTGTISPKYDNALGQHLSQAGTKAFAAHLAKQVGAFSARGRIMDGVWLDRPSAYYTGVWAKNAALTSYGVSNSAAPVVQSTLFNQSGGANITQNADGLPVRPISLGGRGITVGTHTTGHGIDGTIKLARRDAVIEFWTGAYRDASIDLAGTEIAVTVQADGVTIYSTTTDHIARRHLIPVHGADGATISITNSDGGIYYIEVAQLTARELGVGGKLIPARAKVACMGDSWFEFYDGMFASTLATLTGASVDNYALGGQTTEWALSWFDTYIKGKGYDVVVLHFYTNDSNDLSADTFVDPDGVSQPKWPSGLTSDQAKDYWRDNMTKLIKRIQSEGARPVVILPCGTAANSQMQKHAEWSWHLDKSSPLDLIPVTGELADSTSFLNNFGKFAGAQTPFGQGVLFAAGSDPADGWANPVGDALVPLQQMVLTAADYSAPDTFTIGTDGDADGLSDGIGYLSFGTRETNGETFTPSIVGGAQRYVSAFTSPNDGAKRLKFDFSVTSGKDYMFVAEITNGPASTSLEFLGNINGGYTIVDVPQRTLDDAGNGVLYQREIADSTKTASVGIAPQRVNGSTISIDVVSVYCVDMEALAVAAPNTATMSDAEIAAFVAGML